MKRNNEMGRGKATRRSMWGWGPVVGETTIRDAWRYISLGGVAAIRTRRASALSRQETGSPCGQLTSPSLPTTTAAAAN